MNNNNDIVSLIQERLEIGKREYKQQVDVHDGRNWSQEALEEALDLAVYLSAEIVKRKEPLQYKYIVTARLSDHENGTFIFCTEDRSKASGDWLKHKTFWHLTEEYLGIAQQDVHEYIEEEYADGYVVSIVEVTSDFVTTHQVMGSFCLHAIDYIKREKNEQTNTNQH
jgi:hypothetical protein